MKKVHLIGNSHIDPVWLWRWQEGFAEIKATFRSTLDRMKEFPELKFSSNCSSYYMWIEKSDPNMFEEIKARVKEGRWCIVGGMLVQPDCNIPSGEAFARHALISQRYFENKFGVRAHTGYNVDSFGHNGNMPQILRESGMDSYVFMRPMSHELTLEHNLFNWKSADGSSIKAYRIPEVYCVRELEAEPYKKTADIDTPYDQMLLFGVGNHGGGPTIELLDWMKKNLGEEFIYSTPDEYFKSVKDAEVPTREGDLLYHAQGCYSANSKIKEYNRRSENKLIEGERYSVLSKHLMGTEYPAAELNKAWKNVLFNQFHDVLDGCCIKEAYDDAAHVSEEALAIADREINFACQQISWNIDTLGDRKLPKYPFSSPEETVIDGLPLVVFNSLAHEVKQVVTVHGINPDYRIPGGGVLAYVTDSQGNKIPSQTVRSSRTNLDDKLATAFIATVPALGYATYHLYHNGEQCKYDVAFTCSENSLENSKLRLVFDEKTGELTSIFDKENGRELLSSASETVLIDETALDTWGHNVYEYQKVAEKCTEGSLKLLEAGAVRATMRSTQRIGNSTVRRDYILAADSDVIKVKTTVDFHEKHRMLKLRLPVNAKAPEAFAELPFGFIQKGTLGKEEICGSAVVIREGDRGITVANDSKYSFDVLGNVYSMTVLRGAIYADHYAVDQRDDECEYMDQGISSFEYSISPYKSISDAKHRAEELNSPVFAITETFHKGELPPVYSGIKVSAENVIVTAVKKCEDDDSIVLRCVEIENRDTDAEIEILGNNFKAHFPHSKIKTFLICDDKVSETNFIEDK